MNDITARLTTAEERLNAAGREVRAIVMELVIAMTLEAFPEAHILEVEGQYGDSGFVLRAQRVTDADRNTIAGFAGDFHTEEWDDFTDEVDQYLDQLADLNPSNWRGANEIVLQAAVTAEVLITTYVDPAYADLMNLANLVEGAEKGAALQSAQLLRELSQILHRILPDK